MKQSPVSALGIVIAMNFLTAFAPFAVCCCDGFRFQGEGRFSSDRLYGADVRIDFPTIIEGSSERFD